MLFTPSLEHAKVALRVCQPKEDDDSFTSVTVTLFLLCGSLRQVLAKVLQR